MKRLSQEALERLKETVEAEEAAGDPQVARDLEILLEWYEEYTQERKEADIA